MKIVKDTNEKYHSSPAISASGLKSIWLTSVYDYNRQVWEDKPAYRMGNMIHEMILEPEEFKKNYSFCLEKIDRRTKEGKAKYAQLVKENEGTELVTVDDSKILLGIKETFFSDDEQSKIALEYLKGEAEVSHYLKYKGVDVRVRPDMKGKNFISDIKTTTFDTTKAIDYQIKNTIKYFGYHLQATFYSDMLGYNPANFRFIWVEKKAPFRVIVSALSDEMISEGRMGYERALKDWKTYLDTGYEQRFRFKKSSDGALLT